MGWTLGTDGGDVEVDEGWTGGPTEIGGTGGTFETIRFQTVNGRVD